MRRERLLRVAAVLAVPLALVLIVLAADAQLWQRALGAADVRFEAAPRAPGDRWDVDGVLPASVARPLLGVEDDLEYRRAVQLFARVEPGTVVVFGPHLERLLGEAQLELGRISREDRNRRRKSNALNLLGVFQMGRSIRGGGIVDINERIAVLRQGVSLFQGAVRTDSRNDDAKLNLELALRDAGAVILPGSIPSGTRAEGERSGAGREGGGY